MSTCGIKEKFCSEFNIILQSDDTCCIIKILVFFLGSGEGASEPFLIFLSDRGVYVNHGGRALRPHLSLC